MSLTVLCKDERLTPQDVAQLALKQWQEFHKHGEGTQLKAEMNNPKYKMKLEWLEARGCEISDGFQTATSREFKTLFLNWFEPNESDAKKVVNGDVADGCSFNPDGSLSGHPA